MLKFLFCVLIFILGFFNGGVFINMLILNRPEVIYIAETLVACKSHGGIAYLSNTGINSKCKDGEVLARGNGPEVIKYYNYIKQKQILGVTYIDYVNFDYNNIKD